MSDKPLCNWPINEQGLVHVRDIIEPPGGCIIPPAVRGFISVQQDVDQYGHPVDPRGDWNCDHRNTPEWKAHHHRAKVRLQPKKESPMSLPRNIVPNPPADVELEDPQEAENDPQSASVAVPPVPSSDDLARIAHGAGGGLNGIVLALVAAVGGGGAIWKYLQSKQRASAKKDELAHEQRMKELELQQQNKDDQHKACDAARETLAARLSALDEKVTSLSFNLRDLQSRLQELVSKLDTIQDGIVKLAADDRELNERLEELEAYKAPAKRKSR